MSKLSEIMTAIGLYLVGGGIYSVTNPPKRPRKVWDKDLKCYTINGVPVDRNGKPIKTEAK